MTPNTSNIKSPRKFSKLALLPSPRWETQTLIQMVRTSSSRWTDWRSINFPHPRKHMGHLPWTHFFVFFSRWKSEFYLVPRSSIKNMQRFPGVFMNLAMKKDENNAFGTQMTARDDSMIRMTGKRRVTPQANGVYRRLTWTWKSTGKRCTVQPFWWALWFLGRKNISPWGEWKTWGTRWWKSPFWWLRIWESFPKSRRA